VSNERTLQPDRKPKPAAAKPSRPRSAERYERRREEIVDIAAHVFAERGYHATSIDDLSEATGLQRGGLYHYIGGKQELLIRIHERFIEPLLANAREIAARDEPPDVELRLLAQALAQDIADYRDQVTVFLHEWRIIEDAPEWKDIRRARKEFEGIVTSCLARGVHQGVFRSIDERTTMRGFLGMINYTYQWLNPRGRISPTAVADTFVDIFLRGILVDPERGA
jgi:TetR/AcrR family transcriptional regulator, cholesterol catabolism regulator